MHTYQWNLANVIFLQRKSSTSDTFSAPKASDLYHQKIQAINNMHPPKTAKQVCAFPGLVGYYRKFIKNFAKIAKTLTLLTCQKANFEWTPIHYTSFLILKESVTQAPIPTLSRPIKLVHGLHRCIIWCIRSTALTRKQWNGISNSFSFTHLHGHREGNGAPQNKKPTECIMQSWNGILPSWSWGYCM